MVSHVRLFCLLIISLWVLKAHSASINATASVDRQTITADDTLTLTIRIDDVGTYKTPDLNALERDFRVLGSNQSSRRSIVNGSSNSMTEWTISLYPKREGLLLIPAITINDASTKPIAIQVNKPTALPPGQLDTVYIENTVSDREVYVQQQILLKLSVYHSIQLDDLNVNDLNIENATVKQVAQNSFYRTVKGIRHRVHEIIYAIFPEQAGAFIIPEQIFSGREIGQSRFYSGRGKLVRRKTAAIKIMVKPEDKDFEGDLWLPTKNLKLQEIWSHDPNKLYVGDSITRSITTTANGVTAAQLPPISFEAFRGGKLYPDQAQTNNQESATGINATRTDSTAIITTRAGTMTLPEVTVQWWDIDSQAMKVARIAETTINVSPALEQEEITIGNARDNSQQVQPKETIATKPVVNPFWIIASFIMLALWLLTLLAWWRLKQQLSYQNSLQVKETTNNKPSKKQAYKYLQHVCRHNDLPKIRPALIQWAQAHWPLDTIANLDDIINITNNKSLTSLLMQLDNNLYGKDFESSHWDGKKLLILINKINSTADIEKTLSNDLPNLYK